MLHILTSIPIALSLMLGAAGHGRQVLTGDQPIAGNEAGARCPLIYAPVICDNGKTYPNQCVADKHHAKNCVPTGDL